MDALVQKTANSLGKNSADGRIASCFRAFFRSKFGLIFLIILLVFAQFPSSKVHSASMQPKDIEKPSPCLCLWAFSEYLGCLRHPGMTDFERFFDLAEKQLNHWGRYGFDRTKYSSMLIDEIAVVDMSDEQLLAAMDYEAGNWQFHVNHLLNKPEKWGISKDVRPYLRHIDDLATVIFYLVHISPCDTRAGSISGDGSRYWLLKHEWQQRQSS